MRMRYMDESLMLRNLVLSTEPFEHPHTGERIAKVIQENLEDIFLEDRLITAVGDNAKNVVRIGPHLARGQIQPALLDKCMQYITCLGHNCHLVLTADAVKDQRFKPVVQILGKIKKIHGVLAYKSNELRDEFAKQQFTELIQHLEEVIAASKELLDDEELPEYGNEEFEKSVKAAYQESVEGFENHTRFEQLNVTRWKSAANMTSSFIKNFDAIETLLRNAKRLDLIMTAQEHRKAVEIKHLFSVFADNLDIIQSGSTSTSILYLAIIRKIFLRLEAKSTDNECSIKESFKAVADAFKARVVRNIPYEFLAAACLDPVQIFQDYVQEYLADNNTTAEKILKDMIIRYKLNNSNEIVNAEIQQPERQEPLEKRIRMSFLADLINLSANTAPRDLNLDEEIVKYLQLCRDFNPVNDDVKLFWKRNEKNLATLFALTRTIFAIPVTSADAEQSFSVAGSLLRVARAKMNPHRAHKTLFIHDNVHLLDEK